jgi:RimJ/RimL family protein N-acetyltransferase
MVELIDLSRQSLTGYGIELRPVTPSDLPSLRRWRNSPEVSGQMKDSSYISPSAQRRWFERIQQESNQAHWVVWFKGVRTGYMNVVGQGSLKDQAYLEGGMYVGQSTVRSGLLGFAIALMQLKVVFELARVPVYQTVYKATNKAARRFNEYLGYTEGVLEEGFVQISLDEVAYLATKDRMARYFENV